MSSRARSTADQAELPLHYGRQIVAIEGCYLSTLESENIDTRDIYCLARGYLAGVLDLYSRKIVGWAMSERIDTALVLAALNMVLLHRQPPAGLLFHSDRGVQYACGDCRQALQAAQLVPSMSRKGNCYDNATMESFWNTLKLELIYRRDFA